MENDSRAAMSAGLLTTAGMCEIELAIARRRARARPGVARAGARAARAWWDFTPYIDVGVLDYVMRSREGCVRARDGVK